jgi:hypothetical protein
MINYITDKEFEIIECKNPWFIVHISQLEQIKQLLDKNNWTYDVYPSSSSLETYSDSKTDSQSYDTYTIYINTEISARAVKKAIDNT